MNPLPLIPATTGVVTAEVGGLAREVFQDAFQSETITWRMSNNLTKSCQKHPLLRQTASQICGEITNYEETVKDIQCVERLVLNTQACFLYRDESITSNQRVAELIRLKRQPLYTDLHPDATEKYSLLQSDDLLPVRHKCLIDFQLTDEERARMKRRLTGSVDSLFDDPGVGYDAYQTIFRGPMNFWKIKTSEVTLGSMSGNVNKKSIMKTECNKTILIAIPNELNFHNFKSNKLYKRSVIIKNVSTTLAQYRFEKRPGLSKFTVVIKSMGNETKTIAPGMHIKLTVFFQCDFLEEPEEYLLINVKLGKPVLIKMTGIRDPPILRGTAGNIEDLEDEQCHIRCDANLGANFECGKCFVGEQIIVPTKLTNVGGEGRFFIMSEIDWCSMLIDDVMDSNMILIPPFAMWPIYFELQHDEEIELHTYFYPESYGMQVDKLYILCDNCAVNPIELIGDGLMYEPHYFQLGNNIHKVHSHEGDDDPLADYYIDMGVSLQSGILKNAVFVTNSSAVEIYYRWEKRKANTSRKNRQDKYDHFPIENLTVQPTSGIFPPNSITSFRVVAHTKDITPNQYRVILQLYVEDIPLAAIPKSYGLTIKECRTNRRNSPDTVDVWVADIEVAVHCIPVDVFIHPSLIQNSEDELGSYDDDISATDTDINQSPLTGHWVKYPLRESNVMTDGMFLEEGKAEQKCLLNETLGEDLANLYALDNGTDMDDETLAPVCTPTTMTIARLIADRPLYLGLKSTYTLTLRNLICKPVSFMWGDPAGKDVLRLKIYFEPEFGEIPAGATVPVTAICLAMDTGMIDSFYVPCFVGLSKEPVILGVECIMDALNVTFHFPPATNIILPPCVDSIRVEWHINGSQSALAYLDPRNSEMGEERELMSVDLDLGQAVTEVSVGPTITDTIDYPISETETTHPPTSMAKQKRSSALTQKRGGKGGKDKNGKKVPEPEEEEEEPVQPRSWENLLGGIIWTKDQPDEFITLVTQQSVVPFYKTVVPPITQSIVVEFLELPLRSVEKKTFVIRNETPAESSFSIAIKNFHPIAKTKKKKSRKREIAKTYANVMGYKPNEDWGELKQHNAGALLIIEPMTGSLGPHEAIPIDVYAYADTWGTYTDQILVKILGLPDYIFGICIQVTELPISYPLCRNALRQTPLLRFGAVRRGARIEQRKVVMENTSMVPLAINWHCFLTESDMALNSVPFNVVMKMYSPFNDKDVSLLKVSMKDTSIEKILNNPLAHSDASRTQLDIDNFDPVSCSSSDTSDYSSYTESGTTSTINSVASPSWSGARYDNLQVCGLRASSTMESIGTKETKVSNGLNENILEYFGESQSTIGSWDKNPQSPKETEIELTLTPYYGEPDYNMFTVVPQELFILAGQKGMIEITLNPDTLPLTDGKYEVYGKLLGFIRVAPRDKYKVDCFSRPDGYYLPPTEIDLQVSTVRPSLTFEMSKSDRTFKFYSAAVMSHFKKEVKIKRKYVFHNTEEETMFVNFESTDPFRVISMSTMQLKLKAEDSGGINVFAGECVVVELTCTIDTNWINKVMEMSKDRDTHNITVDFTRALLINHVGTWNQVVKLYIKIFLPLFKLSTSDIQFGFVYVGDFKRMTLTIENLSAEKQLFRIKRRNANVEFTVHPNQGTLPPRPANGNYAINLTVCYNPREPLESSETFEIGTIVPGYQQECEVHGFGSLDERYHLPGS